MSGEKVAAWKKRGEGKKAGKEELLRRRCPNLLNSALGGGGGEIQIGEGKANVKSDLMMKYCHPVLDLLVGEDRGLCKVTTTE